MSGSDINQLAISGNLTRDPELHHLGDGTALCKMRIANNDRITNVAGDWINRPQFFNVTIWAGVGEWAALHLAKGDKVVLAGRLKWSEWDATDGKRQAIEIQADSIVPTHPPRPLRGPPGQRRQHQPHRRRRHPLLTR
jgi:single-strand DNA-binding protein